jgi:2-polyprenyl-6-hydroxyphenyl methylase/3-demethylubiquinone-9 3-methyltransferase
VLTVDLRFAEFPASASTAVTRSSTAKAFSFQIATKDQEETDRYWNAIVSNSGEESACGWCKDKWGLSWQITPIALSEGVTDPDPAVANACSMR